MDLNLQKKLSTCLVWQSLPNSGETNMAIDQILLKDLSDSPILRFYDWNSPTVSFGYFESLANAKAHFPDKNLTYIRRLTGGGIVDHRIDLTYTLIIPRSHPWANLRGAESYRIIHQAVAQALNATGSPCLLTSTSKDKTIQGTPCFANPVEHDIIDSIGQKLAGAGQKRSRQGLLHQGSVIGIQNTNAWKDAFIKQLTSSPISWSHSVNCESESHFYEKVNKLATQRYASAAWTNKRP